MRVLAFCYSEPPVGCSSEAALITLEACCWHVCSTRAHNLKALSAYDPGLAALHVTSVAVCVCLQTLIKIRWMHPSNQAGDIVNRAKGFCRELPRLAVGKAPPAPAPWRQPADLSCLTGGVCADVCWSRDELRLRVRTSELEEFISSPAAGDASQKPGQHTRAGFCFRTKASWPKLAKLSLLQAAHTLVGFA